VNQHCGFFDLQVNGYYGVDFNSDGLSIAATEAACIALQRDGVTGILATVITDDMELMKQRIRWITRARDESMICKSLILGIHVEGPFISGEPGYVGTHPVKHVRRATIEAAQQLIDAGDGLVKLLTLAPECDDDARVTKWLVGEGVRVSAGHCNPTTKQLERAIDFGLSMFTHLGNGCPVLMPRHDNVINRVLALAERLWICFIADGVHVPFVALRNYLKVVGIERAIVVTDAISAAGLGPGTFRLGSQEVVVDEHLATWSTDRSHLMGSAMTMTAVTANLRNEMDLSESGIRALTSDNPKSIIN
jgi:N-acetylglucosamine-6-phosphate deacetylase